MIWKDDVTVREKRSLVIYAREAKGRIFTLIRNSFYMVIFALHTVNRMY